MYYSPKIIYSISIIFCVIYIIHILYTNTNQVVLYQTSDQNVSSTVFITTNQTTTNSSTVPHHDVEKMNEIYCYKAQDVGTIQQLDYNEPPRGKSIFFHETSCKSHKNGKLMINNRQACAVESAALLNPNFQVFLLYVSPGVFPNDKSDSNRYLEALLTYPNINIRHINYGSYLAKTPVESLYKDGLIEKSSYPLIHASDIIRYVTLWRFGGIYLDLDVVIIKSLENLPLNYAGMESSDYVAAGVLSFEATGLGHDWASQCLQDLQKNYNGQEWSFNGPGVVTRLVEKLCNTSRIIDKVMSPDYSCKGYKVYPGKYFYPIYYPSWHMYFDANFSEEVNNLTKDSYAIHVWNKLSKSEQVALNSSVPYVEFAKKFCPKVFEQCDEFF